MIRFLFDSIASLSGGFSFSSASISAFANIFLKVIVFSLLGLVSPVVAVKEREKERKNFFMPQKKLSFLKKKKKKKNK
jgi:pilus assembly protein TadC